ncbi:SRPBCC family protein [Brachybacterium sp. FME24]|uniref:SRPBCC family protein n=1 Tax=Brachybacterium sp. FME24 TaxID=2742605 RepID=UPI0018667927|nr:SRPBCC family protein [Brachybacterium sp. FME24]
MTDNQTHVTVTRTVDAPSKDLFDLLTLPARHPEFDGSGTVRSADDTERITKVGEKFVMNMHREAMGGDYRTHSFVTAFDENKMVGWQPAPEAEDGTAPEQPLGWEWLYELKPTGAGTTEVTLTYDWSKVTDKALLKKVGFPAIPQEDLEQSLNLLAAAVTKP